MKLIALLLLTALSMTASAVESMAGNVIIGITEFNSVGQGTITIAWSPITPAPQNYLVYLSEPGYVSMYEYTELPGTQTRWTVNWTVPLGKTLCFTVAGKTWGVVGERAVPVCLKIVASTT
jgi:hypothetical protein